jgi:tetratricopeptide (TPR) repeat protein
LDGKEVSSKKLLEENVVVVVFWATWSKRSVQQLVEMKELAKQFETEKIQFIAVNVEGQATSQAMKQQIKAKLVELDLPFASIIDDGLKIFYDFGVIAVPSTAVLEKSGILRYGPAGYSHTTRDLIKDSIEILLGLRQPSPDSVISKGYVPNSSSSRYYYMALNLSHRRNYERALGYVSRSIEADSAFPAPYCLEGDIKLNLKDPQAAKVAFKKAIKLDSSSVVAWNGLGKSFLNASELDSAYCALSSARGLDSTYTPAILNLSLCLSQLGQYTEALEFLKQARELNAMNPEILYYLGRVSRESGNNIMAVESYLAALEILFPVR